MTLATPAANADVIADLRTALSRMPATSDIRARVDIHSTNERKDKDDAEKEQAAVAVEVTKNPTGLAITFPQTLLARATHEAQQNAQNPEAQSPTRSSLASVDAISIAESLDYAGVLQRRLARSRIIEQKNGLLDGKPSRVVTLAIDPALSKSERKHVKKFDVTMKLWLDADGVPLVVEESSVMKVSFLVLSFENRETEKVTLSRHGDRLVAIRRDNSSSGSGVGQSFKSRQVTTMTVL